MSIGGPFPGYYAVPPKIIEFYFTFIKKDRHSFLRLSLVQVVILLPLYNEPQLGFFLQGYR